MTSEDRFLERLRRSLPEDERLLVGPGDDAAVVRSRDAPLVATTDTVVEGVDFLSGEAPATVGRRALSVALSDLAAMGAWPDFFLLTIGFPREAGEELPLEIARAAARRGAEFGAVLAGGDLTCAAETFVSVTVWGAPAGKPLLRSGARPGDVVALSGWVGEAAAGLAIARARAGGVRTAEVAAMLPVALSPAHETQLLAAYRGPEPRLPLGRALAKSGSATAAIDVSDGLGVDAARLARASGVRAILERESLPISPALRSYASLASREAVDLALAGGDDYELLFTLPESLAHILADPPPEWGVEVRRVGRIEAGDGESGEGAYLEEETGLRPIGALGFDHFGSPAGETPAPPGEGAPTGADR